jgi:predicted branched-subunit amino acid permease
MKLNGRADTPYWSGAGFAEGLRLAVPAMPVMAMFGAAFGTFAAQKGLSLIEATLMSALMFAGASQFVAAEIWSEPKTVAGIIALVVIVSTVNMRFVLIGASLHPWLGGLPAWQTYPALSVLTEPGWLIATRYRAGGGADSAILLGSGIALWLIWIAATVAGYLAGALMTDPGRYGIDLVMPIFFIVLLVPLWRGPRFALPWAVAGATALLVAKLVPGSWYIIAGTVAGSIAGGFVDERT